MRKQTRDEAIAAFGREQKRADISAFALSLLLDPATCATKIRGKCGYSAIVLDPQRIDSGFVVVSWDGPGNQRRDSTAYYADEYLELTREQSQGWNLNDQEHVAVLVLSEKIRHAMFEGRGGE